MGFEIENDVLKKYREEPGVTEVIIPDGVTKIGEYAFEGCVRLRSVTLPESVREILQGAFYGCAGLTCITIPEGIAKIESRVFSLCTKLTSVVIPDSVTEIGQCAFLQCSRLTSVTIPEHVTEIGKQAFGGCTGLTSVILPGSITVIEDGAFENCKIENIVIPESLASVGVKAFRDCQSLSYRGVLFEKEAYLFELMDVLKVIVNKDYNVWRSGGNHYRMLWKIHCALPDDRELYDYLKEHASEFLRILMKGGSADSIIRLAEEGEMITADNIDMWISFTSEIRQYEIELMLLNYKNEKIGYGEDKRFKL